MKQYKNLLVGCIEQVSNEELLKQYDKHKDIYELIENIPDKDEKDKDKNKRK